MVETTKTKPESFEKLAMEKIPMNESNEIYVNEELSISIYKLDSGSYYVHLIFIIESVKNQNNYRVTKNDFTGSNEKFPDIFLFKVKITDLMDHKNEREIINSFVKILVNLNETDEKEINYLLNKIKILKLSKLITEGLQNNKIPLFLYGAAGTPFYCLNQNVLIFNEKFDELGDEFKNKYINYKDKANDDGIKKYLSNRTIQAKVYSDLKNLDNRKNWDIFCKAFLKNWVMLLISDFKTDKNKDKLYKILNSISEPSVSVSKPSVLILTTNFDGAIPEYLDGVERSNGKDIKALCAIVDNPASLRNIYLAEFKKHLEDEETKKTKDLKSDGEKVRPFRPFIITLRGDVYHVVCKNDVCNSCGKGISLYHSYRKLKDKYEEKYIDSMKNANGALDGNLGVIADECVKEILKCPECGADREITISFPGYEIKEQQIAEMMLSIWEMYGSRISAVCTVGFSGNSDREIVKHLTNYCKKNSCCWFDFGIDKTKEEGSIIKDTEVRADAKKNLGESFYVIDFPDGASSALYDLNKKIEVLLPLDPTDENSSNRKNDNSEEQLSEIPCDQLWSTNASQVKYRVDNEATFEIKRDFSNDLTELYNYFLIPKSLIRINNVNQLSLKDYWWNPLEPPHDIEKHSRLNHSSGFLRVANAWLDIISGKLNLFNESHQEYESNCNDLRKKLSVASLCHDIGHVYFSHLIEDVFKELNWRLDPDKPYNHESLTSLFIKYIPKGKLGVKKDDILNLVQGNSGYTFLNAIVNSPLDSDKIDYIFRDQKWVGLGSRTGSEIPWLTEFLSEQYVNSNGQIFLSGKSALAALKLLSERVYLYDTFFFSPKIRICEKIVTSILVKYFSLKISTKLSCIFKAGEEKTEEKRMKRIFKDIKETFQPKDKIYELIEEGIKRSSSSSVDDKNCHPLIHGDHGFCKVILSINDMYKIVDGTSDNNDYEFFKTTYEEIIEQEEIRPLKTEDVYKSTNVIYKEDEAVKGFIKFMFSSNIISSFERIPEARIILSIGCWAVKEITNDDIKWVNKDQLVQLIKMCQLVLDPDKSQDKKTVSDNLSSIKDGKWLDMLYKKQIIAGPFVINPPDDVTELHEMEDWLDKRKVKIQEIGRELSLLFSGRVLVDVTGPIKVRSYPKTGIMHGEDGKPYISEQFWVPDGDPNTWAPNSKAKVPLASVDFRKSIPQAYKIRVLVIDIEDFKSERNLIRDKFRLICKTHNIKLEQEDWSYEY